MPQTTGSPEGQVSTQPSPVHEHSALPRHENAQLPAQRATHVEKSSQVRLLCGASAIEQTAASRQLLLLASPSEKPPRARASQVRLERVPPEPSQRATEQLTAARSPP